MQELGFFNLFIVWTRSLVLFLSILIVVLSLAIYNSNSTPMIPLLEQDSSILKTERIIYDMIQDRRLIATLVAAQASIFCPLFLLMSSSNIKLCFDYIQNISSIEIWRICIEQFCQFLMPLGLALSWLFCMTFDKKTAKAMLIEYEIESLYVKGSWLSLADMTVEKIKYLVVIILLMEVVAIWIASFKYVAILHRSSSEYNIKLEEEQQV